MNFLFKKNNAVILGSTINPTAISANVHMKLTDNVTENIGGIK